MNQREIDAVKLLLSHFETGVEIDKSEIIKVLSTRFVDTEDVFLQLRKWKKIKQTYYEFYELSKSSIEVLKTPRIKIRRANIYVKRVDIKDCVSRKCLCCGKMFPSQHKYNRMCDNCKIHIS